MYKQLLVLLIGTVLLISCGSESGVVSPTSAAQLYGIWQNEDAGTLRVFEFKASDSTHADLANKSPVYILYLYQTGTTPTIVQRGTYKIVAETFVTTVSWTDTPGSVTVGKDYGNAFVSFNEGSGFSIKSTAGGNRSFVKSDALP